MDIFCKVCAFIVVAGFGIGVSFLLGHIIVSMTIALLKFLESHKEKVFMIQYIPSGFITDNPTLHNRFVRVAHILAKDKTMAIGKFLNDYRAECYPYILNVQNVLT